MKLTLFYDGHCPFCVAEMTKLKAYDQNGNLLLEDIQLPDFKERFPDLCWQDLNDRIHGQLPDGSLITGLDVTFLAWKYVGKGRIYAPLRWPVIRWFADAFYVFFARNRYTISYLLTGKKRSESCSDSVCSKRQSND
tara:strand:- start:13662 stop:14072 length:411 start_codon:yes stop_codon:yes gene_type:complete